MAARTDSGNSGCSASTSKVFIAASFYPEAPRSALETDAKATPSPYPERFSPLAQWSGGRPAEDHFFRLLPLV